MLLQAVIKLVHEKDEDIYHNNPEINSSQKMETDCYTPNRNHSVNKVIFLHGHKSSSPFTLSKRIGMEVNF